MTPPPRLCAWCRAAIADGARRDSITCSKRCRQARQRFTIAVGHAPDGAGAAGHPLRLAYADPPYPGLSRKYYEDHADYAGEVDHAELISRLASTFDGWALSTSAASLQAVLALCPPGVRVASWHRGERPTVSRGPLNGWEPVIFSGGRPSAVADGRGQARRLDVLEHFSRPRLADPDRVVGAKPAVFTRWIFQLLGALPGDDFTDLFPGSGGFDRAWALYTQPLTERHPS